MKRNVGVQKRTSKRRKLEELVGWGQPVVTGSSLRKDLEGQRLETTTTTAKEMPLAVVEDRLEKETRRMLAMDKNVPEGRTAKRKEMSQAGKRKKFIFNTRGKITSKESQELERTHGNIFDWVQKEKRVFAEKHTFEKKEEAEIEVEDMEVDTMAEMAENSHDISYRENQPLVSSRTLRTVK